MSSTAQKVQNIVDYYADLLIIQYHNKTKAKTTIEDLTEELMGDGLSFELERAFDLDTAVGPALDYLAKYAGIPTVESYYINGGHVTLTDTQLRQLINLKINTNNTRSTFSELKRLMYENFATDFAIFDTKDMSITILSTPAAAILGQIAIQQRFFPIPACVGFSYYQVEDLSELFGFITYDSNIGLNLGFGDYSGAVGGYFISYSDNVII
jgi:hypothetical protein